MNLGRASYLVIPCVLLATWVAVYLPWAQRHPAADRLAVESLPPAVLVWPQPDPPKDPPEVAALKRELAALQAQLVAGVEKEARDQQAKTHGAAQPPRTTPGAAVDEPARLP